MGDASNVSFSEEESFDTLIAFLEYYAADIENSIEKDYEDDELTPSNI